MALKPHVRLNTTTQQEPPITLKFYYGGPDGQEPEEEEAPKNYVPMANAFRSYLGRFINDLRNRVSSRDPGLEVPAHIEYLQVMFHSQFIVSAFYSQWFNEFGLQGVHFSKFNTEVIFFIAERRKFAGFLNQVENFIRKELDEDPAATYSGKILFVKEFKLLTSPDMLQYGEAGALMNFRIVDDFPMNKQVFSGIFEALVKYFRDNNIEFNYSESAKNLEVLGSTEQQIREIVDNFDIVLQVTSSLATVIGPSALNLPERSYGFEISNAGEDLPLIGIVDSGISNATPLAVILENDQAFNLTGTSVFEDSVNHGTAVGALAALGKKAYAYGYRGSIPADARLLSIKIVDSASVFLSQRAVLAQLVAAKAKYPGIKIFVLTVCYQGHKSTNEDYSSYAFELDKFAHDNDCLLCICTANNDAASADNNRYDVGYFSHEVTNLCTPAESMNNITVGAAAHSLRPGAFAGIATGPEFPALYSRKGHIDMQSLSLLSGSKINKRYFKPDVIECGGDYEHSPGGHVIGQGNIASMEVLSSNRAESFYNQIGTSFAAPLVANIAAQLQRLYPSIRTQSLKALIVNSATMNLIRFPAVHKGLQNRTAGHGIADEAKAVFSNDDGITFLLEEEIEPEEVKIFPLNFPAYLTREKLGKKRGIVKVTATLCFSFLPVAGQQLAYCPVHIGFSFFKNHTGEEIMAKNRDAASKLKTNLSWSQNARDKQRPAPYTNTQKLSFPVNVQDLLNEQDTFKLAASCRINPQLLSGTEKPYERPHLFSIVITVEETLKDGSQTGKLYDEMVAVNEVENIAGAGLEGLDEGIAEGES